MKLSPKQYAIALHQALSETNPKNHDQVLDNFAAALAEAGAVGLMPAIEQEYLAYEKEAKGIITAEVASARTLTGDEEANLVRELNEYVSGKVELKKNVDEGLIGGVMIRIGDDLIDGSVKKSLEQLKNELIQ